ncbi:nucleoside-diphosphate kinase [Candidatus Roizmanbacteria bacterium CG_4_10_14_0_8_um_filter_39_9]|uniref:nucleoside-diphosphate kinase n=1 Tax=Candidatus Roizmanbacteria bacterium CG_4_10_14_0_8_um_filter_39_9 TaxID=1974829 RepID=A0A2M7QBQ2_9BACT|nr:MAG: nucleoside-diphosphate kinase [Candidatus Roizmanbacteria bacterium CG_4_10_14_0_8_um_filter_39_9]
MNLPIEKTLIILKPDAVKRALVGTIIEQYERMGMKLLAAKMVRPEADVIKNHYPGTNAWIKEMGEKTKASFEKGGLNVKQVLGTDDAFKLGSQVYERLIKYWQEGPIIVMVWEGPHAIELVRKKRGHTIPLLATTGSIHADYLYDSSILAATLNRVVKTFIHASGSHDEANREIEYWFPKHVFPKYKREVDGLYL